MADLPREQIENLEAKLAVARRNRDFAQLKEIGKELNRVLDQFLGENTGDPAQARLTQAKLLNLRGQTLAALFDLTGQISQIEAAIGDLDQSLKLVELQQPSSFVFAIRANLALATLRFAEQINSSRYLGEALRHLTFLKGEWSLDQAPPAILPVINCYCLAKFRLGQVSGDRGLIKESCRDFSLFLNNPALKGDLETAVMNNSIVALFENARRHRNPDLFKMLIGYLDPRTRTMTPNLPFLLKHLASSHVELSKITKDTTSLEHAIGNFEMLSKLLRRFAHSGPLFSLLQSMAAAFYQLSRNLKSDAADEFLNKAIASAREAQNIIRTKGGIDDARMIGILIDLGSYRFEQGVGGGDKSLILEAENDFQTAIARTSSKRSPWLAFRASLGVFRLYYHQGNWERAMEAFELSEEAWSVAITDRQLSHEVHGQKVVEMEGVYSMAAHCCLMLSDLERAVETLERGRAQKMSLLQTGHSGPNSIPDKNERTSLDQALENWERARTTGTPSACEEAWRVYEDLLRKNGLGMESRSFSSSELRQRLPSDSVMVQLFNCPAGFFAILVFGDNRRLEKLKISTEVQAKLGPLFWSPQNPGDRSWGTGYRRFRNPPNPDSEGRKEVFESWHETVKDAIALIGSGVVQQIHEELQRQKFPERSPVFLSPPGEFASLPLASGKLGDGTFFEDHWDVSLIPNGTFLPAGERSRTTELALLAIAHQEATKDELGGLRFAGKEAAMVGSQVQNGTRRVLAGEEASLETTLDQMREASLIHLACHGTYEIRSPQSSGIHLPGGDLLPISRLKKTDHFQLKARLVFLSCCESGITGRSIPPDEFVGLLPSILKCGAEAAIGSLWPVYDDAAMFLCLKFYQLFLDADGTQKMSPAKALAAAKRWLREVTIAELLATGWISNDEIEVLVEARFQTRLLRIRPVGESRTIEVLEEGGSSPKRLMLSPEQMQKCPFSSPVDWAAFILVGA